MIKLRVSGPEERKGEVDAAMNALLDNMRSDGDPDRAAIPATRECPPARSKTARIRADDDGEALTAILLFGAVDAHGEPKTNRNDTSSLTRPRLGTSWCRDDVEAAGSRLPLLRATGADAGRVGGQGRTVLLILYSDSGGTLEVVRLPKSDRYALFNHEIGMTSLLASFDSLPSKDQLAEILAGHGNAARTRARATFKSSGDVTIEMVKPAPESAPASPTT
jgi:hypothetical protein